MNTSLLVVTGIVGTIAMTVCTVLVSLVIKRSYYVVKTLARMLQFRSPTPQKSTPVSYFFATVVHYGIGVGFAYLYYILLSLGVIDLNATYAGLYGILIGTVAVIGWRIFFAVHPSPPHYSLPIYLSMIWLGHIVLSMSMFLTVLVFAAAQNQTSPDMQWVTSYGRSMTLW